MVVCKLTVCSQCDELWGELSVCVVSLLVKEPCLMEGCWLCLAECTASHHGGIGGRNHRHLDRNLRAIPLPSSLFPPSQLFLCRNLLSTAIKFQITQIFAPGPYTAISRRGNTSKSLKISKTNQVSRTYGCLDSLGKIAIFFLRNSNLFPKKKNEL